jgi:hypothetical protein
MNLTWTIVVEIKMKLIALNFMGFKQQNLS